MNSSRTVPQDTKKVFMKFLTCSRTFCYLLNREFGYTKENEERASDPFAGGLVQLGHQCGMLWGATLAVGAESFRRFNDRGQAIAIACGDSTPYGFLFEDGKKRRLPRYNSF